VNLVVCLNREYGNGSKNKGRNLGKIIKKELEVGERSSGTCKYGAVVSVTQQSLKLNLIKSVP